MPKSLRVLSLNFGISAAGIISDDFDTDRALFDFDVVVIRPQTIPRLRGTREGYDKLHSLMLKKSFELEALFSQGGVLVVLLDVPTYYEYTERGYEKSPYVVSSYDFLDSRFASLLRNGRGEQVRYDQQPEPFIAAMKKSAVAWTTYMPKLPQNPPLSSLKFFAWAGSAGGIAAKMRMKDGHLILLPLVTRLGVDEFLDACAEYRFKRQETPQPAWVHQTLVPGLPPIELTIAELDKQISDLLGARQQCEKALEERAAYRKLLYEKGKYQLEPIVRRALDDLEFGTTRGEIIKGTNFEIDGRTTNGSSPGILEIKGSKKQILQDEFSPFITKILADSEVTNRFSKGILVGNGLCETEPKTRLGDKVFSSHVLEGARRHSVALINSVELYWLCCARLAGEPVDFKAVQESILTCNGYVDLKPFCGTSPFPP